MSSEGQELSSADALLAKWRKSVAAADEALLSGREALGCGDADDEGAEAAAAATPPASAKRPLAAAAVAPPTPPADEDAHAPGNAKRTRREHED